MGATMPSTTDQLITGTIRGDRGALRELLAHLRPHCAHKLFAHFGYLRDEQADLLDEAESLLFEWAVSPQAWELLPADESLSKLAFRLLSRVVQERRRQQRRNARLVDEMTAAADVLGTTTESEAFGTEEVVAALESLPEKHREVLLAELQFQIGDGPALDAALSA